MQPGEQVGLGQRHSGMGELGTWSSRCGTEDCRPGNAPFSTRFLHRPIGFGLGLPSSVASSLDSSRRAMSSDYVWLLPTHAPQGCPVAADASAAKAGAAGPHGNAGAESLCLCSVERPHRIRTADVGKNCCVQHMKISFAVSPKMARQRFCRQ